MINFKIEDGLVYKEKIGKKSKTTICVGNTEVLNIPNIKAKISTLTNIPITYQIFDLEQQKYTTDESINKTVDVYLDSVLIGTEGIMDGIGNIEFNSAEVGTFKLKIENTECEVIVSEN